MAARRGIGKQAFLSGLKSCWIEFNKPSEQAQHFCSSCGWCLFENRILPKPKIENEREARGMTCPADTNLIGLWILMHTFCCNATTIASIRKICTPRLTFRSDSGQSRDGNLCTTTTIESTNKATNNNQPGTLGALRTAQSRSRSTVIVAVPAVVLTGGLLLGAWCCLPAFS